MGTTKVGDAALDLFLALYERLGEAETLAKMGITDGGSLTPVARRELAQTLVITQAVLDLTVSVDDLLEDREPVGELEEEEEEEDPRGEEPAKPRALERGPIVLKGRNPVSLLQEVAQARGWGPPEYDYVDKGEKEPPARRFSSSVRIADREDGQARFIGVGRSKQESKERAARNYLLESLSARENY